MTDNTGTALVYVVDRCLVFSSLCPMNFDIVTLDIYMHGYFDRRIITLNWDRGQSIYRTNRTIRQKKKNV